jgi:hypothetical protein
MFVPSCARAKADAIKKTPARLPDDPSLRNDVKSSKGFQMGAPPKITTEEDETMIPIKEVTAKPVGIVKN